MPRVSNEDFRLNAGSRDNRAGHWNTAQLCDDKDGTGAAGTAVKVWLPCPESMDPNVYSGNVILIQPDPGDPGNYVVVSDVNDAKIGTIRERDDTSIPQGWDEIERLEGRFVVGRDADDPDYNALTDVGGYTFHGMTENNHPDHLPHGHYMGCENGFLPNGGYQNSSLEIYGPLYWDDGTPKAMNLRHGGIVNDWPDDPEPDPEWGKHPKADTDNRPPFAVVQYMIRIAP